ncbi:unnamed protein product [Adineta steineri]|uniref:Uncharacterized protein n=1 Tax=Adineta steineri TaxID=433720 RepID=A0A819NWT8_9BILA|nr:unnamed protein product [Adineta steineri]CAF1453972.1 unnamed protein product [Adineta steineri]CAF1533766.1 unnamed protein product [Adineta steineri]CAF3976695.1 unnamed protein product [Adineta steineri]CAF4003498.1 unnamed protein product [Adineta steineri]
MSSKEIDDASVDEFDPNRALGLWHILATNLNIWKNKLTPTVTYTFHNQLPDKRVQMNDVVEYYTKRPFVGFTPASIIGVDTQISSKLSRFQWRKNGIIKLYTNEFSFVFADDETPDDEPYQWVATMVGSTLFSSAGMNLMTRTRQPPTHVLNSFVRICQEHPILKTKSRNMFYTREKEEDVIYYIRDLQID